MLTVENISVNYDHVRALVRCSLHVPPGAIVTLLGANGAGKTSMLHAIAGLISPFSGSIVFQGKRISGRSPAEIVKSGISLVAEHRQLFPGMTVEENLILGAYTNGMRRRGKSLLADVFSLFPELTPLARSYAATLSGGQQQMLAVGRGLMAQPRLLLLDEPSLGLAPLLVDRLLAALREINSRGVTILLVEQNAFRTLPLSLLTYVLESGQVVLSGPSSDLIKDPRIQSSYLGTL